jgi:hypothetical protein
VHAFSTCKKKCRILVDSAVYEALQIRNIYAPPYHIENYVRLWETPRIQCIQNIGNPVHDSSSCHGECANIVGFCREVCRKFTIKNMYSLCTKLKSAFANRKPPEKNPIADAHLHSI